MRSLEPCDFAGNLRNRSHNPIRLRLQVRRQTKLAPTNHRIKRHYHDGGHLLHCGFWALQRFTLTGFLGSEHTVTAFDG